MTKRLTLANLKWVTSNRGLRVVNWAKIIKEEELLVLGQVDELEVASRRVCGPEQNKGVQSLLPLVFFNLQQQWLWVKHEHDHDHAGSKVEAEVCWDQPQN